MKLPNKINPRKSIKHLPQSKVILFATVFAVIGVIMLLFTRAATPFASLETEKGVRTPAAQQVADGNASGGYAVRFGGTTANKGYKVNGRFLYDPCGERVIVRGVENFFWNPWLYPDGSIIPEIGKTGSNTIRIVAAYPPNTLGFDPLTIQQVETLIQKSIASKMIPDIALAGGDVNAYLRPEVISMLQKYQDKIVIHAAGEGQQDTEDQWVAQSKTVISQMRTAGYTVPLYIMSNTFGRNLPTLLNRGAEVLASDPLNNIVFGWQAYWPNGDNYYQDLYGMTLHQAMQRVRDVPFMIQVGLTYETDPWKYRLSMDYSLAMADAQAYEISWLWWDWRLGGPPASLVATEDGVYGNWQQPFGYDVVIGNSNSISKTSQRTNFLNTGSCQ